MRKKYANDFLTMVDRFLKAKHWQIFLFGVGIPFAVQMALFIVLITKLNSVAIAENPVETFFTKGIIGSYLGIFAISFLSLFVLYGWMYSIGVGLKKYLPRDVHSHDGYVLSHYSTTPVCHVLWNLRPEICRQNYQECRTSTACQIQRLHRVFLLGLVLSDRNLDTPAPNQQNRIGPNF